MLSEKNILICPLNWGLGHASRIIPLIEKYQDDGYTVHLASDGDALHFLKKHFPDHTIHELPSLNIRYWNKIGTTLSLLIQIPKIFRWITNDHKTIAKISAKHNFQIIFSDNRWGAWHGDIYSIFMTHQLMVKLPGLLKIFEKAIFLVQLRLLKKFNEINIPDFKDITNSLSGDLSHKYIPYIKTNFIGPLTRFKEIRANVDQRFDVAVILSGPEPQRSILEKILIEKIGDSSLNYIIIAGKPDSQFKNERYLSFADSNELNRIICNSEIIICRSGYSSIMDLYLLNKKAIMIPTPGQTEQEYLAQYLINHNHFKFIRQSKLTEIDLIKAITDFLK